MKTTEQVLIEVTESTEQDYKQNIKMISVELAEIAMREYAKEVLEDFDNWKAHKTPDLVKQYIKEKGL